MENHSEAAQMVVVMVPFPSHSHLNQLLQLACLISTFNLQVHYACSATHIRQAKLRFNEKNCLNVTKIHFHELPTPTFPSPPPNPYSSHKFPLHLLPSFENSIHLRHPVAELLRKISLTAKRVVIIHDLLMSYVVQDIATIPNAESYGFNPISAFTSFFDVCQMLGKSMKTEEPKGLPSIEGCYPFDLLMFIALQNKFVGLAAGIIYNTCRSIEGTYIDIQKEDTINANQQLWTIGPLNLQIKNENTSSNSRHKCLEWLDKQDPRSVLYISFGSITSMKDEQIKELAMGLEQSKQKFIWVLRDADRGDIFAGDEKRALLPEGYEERVKEYGIVERDWAPQMEILEHPSTGGFMSHCGWNSCLESITMGVPIATWPMHSDQPKNAFLVTDVLKIGIVVSHWECREELVSSETIRQVVERLMGSKEGEGLRNRVEELADATRKAVKEGGVSQMELNSFVAHITR